MGASYGEAPGRGEVEPRGIEDTTRSRESLTLLPLAEDEEEEEEEDEGRARLKGMLLAGLMLVAWVELAPPSLLLLPPACIGQPGGGEGPLVAFVAAVGAGTRAARNCDSRYFWRRRPATAA